MGQSGILPDQPFPELPRKPLALINHIPSDPTELLKVAIADALIMANLSPPLLNCGVVIGSSRGYQGKLEKLARKEETINLIKFRDYLHFNIALNAGKIIGSTGIVLSPMAACSTGIWAIAQGFELIKTQQCQRVIVGAVEAPITPLTLAG
ncbi:MAG: beta-ketoacyl synthase N-terminal-like domain-containing protein, partial [Planktothrix sp.]